MELTVYRHNERHPYHIEVALDASDFDRKVKVNHEVDERVRMIQSGGSCLLEVLAHVTPKAEVLRELFEKVGSATDIMDLFNVERCYSERFEKMLSLGDFEQAAAYACKAKLVDTKLRTRRDAKAVTIRAKVEATMEDLVSQAQAQLVELTDAMVNVVQYNAKQQRESYQDYVLRQINSNGEHFESNHASEIAEQRERIVALEAMLNDAKKKIRRLKNEEVASFARNDGQLGPDSPIAPVVLAEIEAKAKSESFFPDSPFSIGL